MDYQTVPGWELVNAVGRDPAMRVREAGNATVRIFNGASSFTFNRKGFTKYLFMSKPAPVWIDNADRHEVKAGMFLASPGVVQVCGGAGFAVELPYNGIFTLGGPVEEVGRLKYINGASDTLLVAPLKKGDPCMNFLHVPQGIDQQPHTHPSLRVGMILRGAGKAIVADKAFDLVPGSVFILEPDTVHSFHTPDTFLDIVVVHPDSDFGPTDDEHPMLNRTLVDGVRVNEMTEIRTKEIIH